MKIAVLIFLVLFSFNSYSQDVNSRLDSLEKKYQKSQSEITQIKSQLTKSHEEFSAGIIITFLGIAAGVAGTLIEQPALIAAGGLGAVAGVGLTIDSNKFLSFKKTR